MRQKKWRTWGRRGSWGVSVLNRPCGNVFFFLQYRTTYASGSQSDYDSHVVSPPPPPLHCTSLLSAAKLKIIAQLKPEISIPPPKNRNMSSTVLF